MAYISLIISAVCIGIDQLIKFFIIGNFQLFDTKQVIKFGDTEIFNLTYVLNEGAGWSILSGKTGFLIGFTSLLMIGVIIYLFKFAEKKPIVITSLGLIIGGGIGNLIDRIFRDGAVIDYIDARFIDFPIFNFADICVVIGAFILIFYMLIDEVKISKKKKLEIEKTNEKS